MDDGSKSPNSTESANTTQRPSSLIQDASQVLKQEQQPANKKSNSGWFICQIFWVILAPIKHLIQFLDKHGGAVTTSATIAMVVLTFFLAKYAKEQGDIARDTLLSNQRAYVFINNIDMVYGDDAATKFWQVIPRWENAGNTATYQMSSRINYYSLPTDLPTGFSRCDFDAQETRFVLSSKEKSNVSFMRIDPTTLQNFKIAGSAVRHMKFWGWTKYQDTVAYQDHITRFCWNIESIGGNPSDPNANLRMTHSLCKEGNCTDKECEAEDAANYSIPKTPQGCKLAFIPVSAQNATPIPSPQTPANVPAMPRSKRAK